MGLGVSPELLSRPQHNGSSRCRQADTAMRHAGALVHMLVSLGSAEVHGIKLISQLQQVLLLRGDIVRVIILVTSMF